LAVALGLAIAAGLNVALRRLAIALLGPSVTLRRLTISLLGLSVTLGRLAIALLGPSVTLGRLAVVCPWGLAMSWLRLAVTGRWLGGTTRTALLPGVAIVHLFLLLPHFLGKGFGLVATDHPIPVEVHLGELIGKRLQIFLPRDAIVAVDVVFLHEELHGITALAPGERCGKGQQ
jgi:hypothetical protein